ncbi:MAG TPA: hypothetical protein EYQ25_03755 [Planctomycetes bacterium]|nr:hypothetical protein [Planctomycetota bacterium]
METAQGKKDKGGPSEGAGVTFALGKGRAAGCLCGGSKMGMRELQRNAWGYREGVSTGRWWYLWPEV